MPSHFPITGGGTLTIEDRTGPKRIFSYRNCAVNPHYNLPQEQRRIQQPVAQFNADEQLWRSLQTRRRWRRKLCPQIPASLRRQLDLLEFAHARPPEDCVGLLFS